MSDPKKMREIAAEAAKKSSKDRPGPLSGILEEVSALIRLVVAYARGNYRDVSRQSMIVILGGLIYLISPIDLIPDFLPGGLLDDAVVLVWVIKTVRLELDAFIEWENQSD